MKMRCDKRQLRQLVNVNFVANAGQIAGKLDSVGASLALEPRTDRLKVRCSYIAHEIA
jgi:hypothetical protein